MRGNRGITLIALVITIIVLLLLAGVSIAMLTGENGILVQAMEAGDNTEKAEAEEKLGLALSEYRMKKYTADDLDLKTFLASHPYITEIEGATAPYNVTVDGYVTTVDGNGNYDKEGFKAVDSNESTEEPEVVISIIADIATSEVEVYSETENTILADEYGNKVVVPAGFGISSDSGNNVTKGIVIVDPENGNEFVWVPVSENIKYEENGESKTTEVILDRYEFDQNGIATRLFGDSTDANSYGSINDNAYLEEQTSTVGNIVSEDLKMFKDKVEISDGYYIARYEASNNNEVAESKQGVETWNGITQAVAAEKAKAMYGDETVFTSDLINSYAWDTALVYIQTFSGDVDYSMQGSTTSTVGLTGTSNDEVLKINDMASNMREWSTETSTKLNSAVVRRGGLAGYPASASSYRSTYAKDYTSTSFGFRAILYL